MSEFQPAGILSNGCSTVPPPSFSHPSTHRPRQIDVERQLEIIRTEDLLAMEDLNALRSVPAVATGMEKEDEGEVHVQDALRKRTAYTRDAAAIPVPSVKVVDGYDDDLPTHPSTRPARYIRLHSMPIKEDPLYVEYDADDEDVRWVDEFNASGGSITLDVLEVVFTVMERLAAAAGMDEEPASLAKTLKLLPSLPPGVLGAIRAYWAIKRARKGRPLLRSLMPVPEFNEPDPYIPFRPRELKQQRKKAPNEPGSLSLMRQLRHELERAMACTEVTRRRERLKREQVVVAQALFMQRLDESRRPAVYRKSVRKVSTDLASLGVKDETASAPVGDSAAPVPGSSTDADSYTTCSSEEDSDPDRVALPLAWKAMGGDASMMDPIPAETSVSIPLKATDYVPPSVVVADVSAAPPPVEVVGRKRGSKRDAKRRAQHLEMDASDGEDIGIEDRQDDVVEGKAVWNRRERRRQTSKLRQAQIGMVAGATVSHAIGLVPPPRKRRSQSRTTGKAAAVAEVATSVALGAAVPAPRGVLRVGRGGRMMVDRSSWDSGVRPSYLPEAVPDVLPGLL